MHKGASNVIGAINNDLREILLGLPKVSRVMWHVFWGARGWGGGNLTEFKKGVRFYVHTLH